MEDEPGGPCGKSDRQARGGMVCRTEVGFLGCCFYGPANQILSGDCLPHANRSGGASRVDPQLAEGKPVEKAHAICYAVAGVACVPRAGRQFFSGLPVVPGESQPLQAIGI